MYLKVLQASPSWSHCLCIHKTRFHYGGIAHAGSRSILEHEIIKSISQAPSSFNSSLRFLAPNRSLQNYNHQEQPIHAAPSKAGLWIQVGRITCRLPLSQYSISSHASKTPPDVSPLSLFATSKGVPSPLLAEPPDATLAGVPISVFVFLLFGRDDCRACRQRAVSMI